MAEKKYTYPGETLFVTFYSFKGGVGRSLALANAGAILAAAGRKTLLIDADLEAPGLGRILGFKDKSQPGMVEYIFALKDFLIIPKGKKKSDAARKTIKPDPSKYIASLNIQELCKDPKPGGCLDFMPAGIRGSDYATNVERLGIREMYENNGPGLGIFLAFKQSIRDLKESISDLRNKYDYVLIDSRTGYSDIGVVCTYDLADAFVFICGLNEQNILGTKEMIDNLDKNTDSIDREEKRIFVASPVPEAEEVLKKTRFDFFKKVFGQEPDVRLVYHPHLSLIEEIFSQRFPEATISQSYMKLTRLIRKISGDNSDRWFNSAIRSRGDGDYTNLLVSLKYMADTNANWTSQVLRTFISDPTKLVKENNWKDFCQLYVDLNPNDPIGYSNYGIAYSIIGEREANIAHLNTSVDLINKALELDPSDSDFYTNLGNSLCNIGEITGDINAFTKAVESHKKSIELNPEKASYHTNLGIALFRLGEMKTDIESLEKSVESHRKAIELEPLRADYYSHMGAALSRIGEISGDIQILKEAVLSLRKAIKLNPRRSDYHSNLGTTLQIIAEKNKNSKDFEIAVESYRKAIELDPSQLDCQRNLIASLLSLGKLTGEKSYSDAAKKELEKHNLLKNETDIYNLACLEVLFGNREEALKQLQKAVAMNKKYADKAPKDKDFEALWNDAEFLRICGVGKTGGKGKKPTAVVKKKTNAVAAKKPVAVAKKKAAVVADKKTGGSKKKVAVIAKKKPVAVAKKKAKKAK